MESVWSCLFIGDWLQSAGVALKGVSSKGNRISQPVEIRTSWKNSMTRKMSSGHVFVLLYHNKSLFLCDWLMGHMSQFPN
jgi:hypothetical protein